MTALFGLLTLVSFMAFGLIPIGGAYALSYSRDHGYATSVTTRRLIIAVSVVWAISLICLGVSAHALGTSLPR